MKRGHATAPMNRPESLKNRFASKDRGVALFIAISLLALFSVLGASYLRYMSIEIEAADINLRVMRARHYAAAGVYSALGNIREAVSRDAAPLASTIYTYGMYAGVPGNAQQAPTPVDTYNAQARVTVAAMDEDAWNDYFNDGPSWPGEARAFHVISEAQIERAGPGLMIRLAAHAVEAVLVAHNECCDIIYWGVYKSDAPSE